MAALDAETKIVEDKTDSPVVNIEPEIEEKKEETIEIPEQSVIEDVENISSHSRKEKRKEKKEKKRKRQETEKEVK